MRKSYSIEKSQKRTPFMIGASIVIGIYCLTLVVALGWAMFSSFKYNWDFKTDKFGWPKHGMTIENFITVLTSFQKDVTLADGSQGSVDMLGMFFYSLVYGVGVSFIGNLSRSMCAYVAAKYRHLRWPLFIHTLVLVLMTIAFPGNLAVTIKFYKMMNLYDNLFLCIFTSFGFTGANFLYFYAAYRGVSDEYREAASIDGANQWTIMFRIMMPMVKNIFIALFVLDFIAHWNDYTPSLVWLPRYPMVAYGLYHFKNNDYPNAVEMFACVSVVIIPTLTIFIVFKDKIVSNLSIGGLKG